MSNEKSTGWTATIPRKSLGSSLIIDAVRNDPPGSYRLFKHPEPEVDMNVANRNRDIVGAKFRHALKMGCFIEALSLRLLSIEEWLKIYVFNVQPIGRNPKRMFGKLLDQCEELGFESVVANRLRTFNETRVNAIHHFLNGQTTYNEIADVLENSNDLSRLVAKFVLNNSGQILTEENFPQEFTNRDAIWHIVGGLYTLPDV